MYLLRLFYTEDLIDSIGLYVIGLIVTVARIVYLKYLTHTLKLVKPHNRLIEPGKLWLMLIPFFNLFYRFVVALKVSRSIQNEFEERNLPTPKDNFSQLLGLVYCCLLSTMPLYILFTGFPGIALGVACWVVYWVKISRYKTTLENA
ncbi:MAG: hypothetical protein IAF38_08525 [Bacteroidia bacterium]|nr:hypothetical protein [Bacteroidia bacterium]